ncbi:lysine-specific demethylase 5d [Nannochloropsis oceanica]
MEEDIAAGTTISTVGSGAATTAATTTMTEEEEEEEEEEAEVEMVFDSAKETEDEEVIASPAAPMQPALPPVNKDEGCSSSSNTTTTTTTNNNNNKNTKNMEIGRESAAAGAAVPAAPAPESADVVPVPEKKKYAYRPPRMGDSFQATVPTFGSETAPEASMNDLRPNQTSLRDGLIWEPSALSGEEVDNYLIMTRGLVIQTSHTRDRHEPRWRRPGVSSTGVLLTADQEAAATAVAAAGGGTGDIIPLEADEQALFYLYQQNYKLDMTFLRLISELGMQKEHKFLHALNTLYQSGASASSLDRRDRSTLIGSFASGGTPYVGYARGGRAAQFPYKYSFPIKVAPLVASKLATNDEDGCGPDDQEEGEEDEAPGEGREKKKRSADKTETRKQYVILAERAGNLWRILEAARKKASSSGSSNSTNNNNNSNNNSNNNLNGESSGGTSTAAGPPATDRPSQAHMMTLLREIASLPNLELPPGDIPAKEMEKSLGGLKEALATSRQYVAKVHDALNTTAGQPSTIADIKDLLEELQQQPIQLLEEAQLSRIVAEATAWQTAAEELAQHLERASLPDAEVLIAAADALPLHFELKTWLQDKVEECRALGKEICAAVPFRAARSMGECQTIEALRRLLERAREVRLQFPEVEVLQAVIGRTEKWLGEAMVAVSETPDLRKLQNLLEDANTIPVDLSETCDVIKGKVEQAHQWVEKVRKALPRKNKTRSNASDAGKVDYTAARTLLNEGEGIRVGVKELDDIAGVLDTAETWLQRVRGALEESTDETGLQSLQALLCEADDIPVEMDEHKILAAEIEARRWGLRVQPRLAGSKVTVKALEKLVAEAAGLRARLPLAAQQQKSWRLPEEIEARSRLQKAYAWLKDHRSCVNPNGLGFRKGVTVHKVLQLLQRARAVPVDLSEPMRQLEDAVVKAEKWLEASAGILQSCGIQQRTAFTLPETKAKAADGAERDSGSADGKGGEGEKEKNAIEDKDEEEVDVDDDDAESSGDDEEILPTGLKVEQEALVECVGEASDIGLELYEAEKLKALLQRMQGWLDQLGVVCPKRMSKRRGMRLKVTVQEVHDLVEQGKALPINLSEEVEEITERLQATLKWQTEVQAELLDIARDGLRESKAYKLKEVKKEREEEMDEANKEAGEGDDVFNETHEKRLKRLEALVDQTSDVGIESAEDDMIIRHLKAHKWASSAIDLLEFVDPKSTINEVCMAEIADVVTDGDGVLHKEVVDEDAECGAMNRQPSSLGRRESPSVSVSEKEGGSSANAGSSSAICSPASATGRGERRWSSSAMAAASATGGETMEMDGAENDEGVGEGEEEDGTGYATKKDFEVYVTEQGEVKKRRLKPKMKKVLVESHGECDEVLQEMMLFWWDQIGSLRRIWETSREWSKRATRLLSPGGEKVKMDVMESLLAETAEWGFNMDLVNRVRAEVERGKSILARATSALEGDDSAKLELPVLKSLITEGDKCKVLVEEIKSLRKHVASGQRWIARYQKSRPEELDEMMALAEEAKEIRMDLGEDLQTVLHSVTRCCFCRQTVDGPLVRCTECGEKYHQRCLAVGETDAVDWERQGWCCPRCLVRWHMRDALAKTMVIVSKWIAVPNASPLGPIPLLGQSMMAQGLYGGGNPILEDPYIRALEVTTGKVKAWMKRLLHAIIVCADRNAEEVRTLGTSKLVKSSVLVEVIRLAKGDSDVDKCADVKEVIWNLSVVFWGARLVCQLRRRPSLVPLQALTAEMQSVGIHNEPLQVMLNNLISRAMEWIYKTKPMLREGWLSGDHAFIDVERLRELMKEKRNIPVRLLLERRVEAMLSEEPGKRYCHCRGFYDGYFMVQCVACNEWFHGKCVQIRAEDLDKKTDYQCVACSEQKKQPYPYLPYRAPDPDLALAEVDEEEEEAVAEAILGGAAGGIDTGGAGLAAIAGGVNMLDQDEEMIMADKVSLEGIFPCKKKLISLDESSNHVDVYLLPLPASLKRKKIVTGGGGERRAPGLSSAMEGASKKKHKPTHSGNAGSGGYGGGSGGGGSKGGGGESGGANGGDGGGSGRSHSKSKKKKPVFPSAPDGGADSGVVAMAGVEPPVAVPVVGVAKPGDLVAAASQRGRVRKPLRKPDDFVFGSGGGGGGGGGGYRK